MDIAIRVSQWWMCKVFLNWLFAGLGGKVWETQRWSICIFKASNNRPIPLSESEWIIKIFVIDLYVCYFLNWYVVTSSPPPSLNVIFNFYGSLGVSLPGTSTNVFKKYIKMPMGIHHLQFPLWDRLVNCAYQTCN